MSSKKVVLLVLAVTIIALIFAWFFLKHIMDEYDVDSNTSQPEYTIIEQSSTF